MPLYFSDNRLRFYKFPLWYFCPNHLLFCNRSHYLLLRRRGRAVRRCSMSRREIFCYDSICLITFNISPVILCICQPVVLYFIQLIVISLFFSTAIQQAGNGCLAKITWGLNFFCISVTLFQIANWRQFRTALLGFRSLTEMRSISSTAASALFAASFPSTCGSGIICRMFKAYNNYVVI